MTVLTNVIRAHDSGFVAADAERDLRRMRRGRAWRQWSDRLWHASGQCNALVDFHQVVAEQGATVRRDLGLQSVDLDTIVGSVGRAGDFDRSFRPGPRIDRRRWESLDRAMRSGESVPPISLYRVD